jgi:YesN/AraC family two-component response regulator
MSFSEYLNIIKVENAIMMLRNKNASITSISRNCGFATIRNFNRVFKKITGYSPKSLPRDFIMDTGLRISTAEHFDPTDESSILI